MQASARRCAPRRRLLAVPFVLALVASACGKGSGNDATSGDSSPGANALTGTLDGSGSTLQQAFDEEAIIRFTAAHPNVTIRYAGTGSGKGRADLQGMLVDFAGSDGLIKPEDLEKYQGGPVLYFPTVATPITISYHLPSVKTLKLTPELIAKIFQRSVTTWNDPAIAATNPGVHLPATAITVARRADDSGTTENVTRYLASAAGSLWTLGSGPTVTWPDGTQSGNGNTGVAAIVGQTVGAVGYVDLADAKAAGLQLARVQNKAGRSVAPTPAAASAAVAGTAVDRNLTYDPINADGDDAYPITAPTWILVYEQQTDRAKADVLKSFLRYVLTDGQGLAAGLNYARLPRSLVRKALAQVDRITVSR